MIYLSGPMTGLPDFNRPLFTIAANSLRLQKHRVLSPHELGVKGPWEHCMKHDLLAMLTFCNKIALLPGWEKSRGCKLEISVASVLGFTTYLVEVIDDQAILTLATNDLSFT